MLYAALDIHKHTFHAAVLDAETGEVAEKRFASTREELNDWASDWQGRLAAVGLEATNGWRWVAQQLQERGFEVRLVDPGRASALRGRRRRPKTDCLDARWLALLLARQLLSECEAWLEGPNAYAQSPSATSPVPHRRGGFHRGSKALNRGRREKLSGGVYDLKQEGNTAPRGRTTRSCRHGDQPCGISRPVRHRAATGVRLAPSSRGRTPASRSQASRDPRFPPFRPSG
jgi:Transposase